MRRREGWEHFDHVADMGVRGWGPTLESAFEQAARAVTAVVTDLAVVHPKERIMIELLNESKDPEFLLIEWLNGVIYEMQVRKMLFSVFEVHFTGKGIRAFAWGEQVDRKRHAPAVEPKGATFTTLRVAHVKEEKRWVAQCVIDI